MISVYDVRCSKALYSMYIIVKSFMWSLQMRERTVDSGAFLTMERDDEVTAFCFARHIVFLGQCKEAVERNAIMPLFYRQEKPLGKRSLRIHVRRHEDVLSVPF